MQVNTIDTVGATRDDLMIRPTKVEVVGHHPDMSGDCVSVLKNTSRWSYNQNTCDPDKLAVLAII